MKVNVFQVGNTPAEMAAYLVLKMGEDQQEAAIAEIVSAGVLNKGEVEAAIAKIKAENAVQSKELTVQFTEATEGVSGLEIVKTDTGRAYTVVAKKGKSKLLVNISYGPMPIKVEGIKGMAAALGLYFRSMETPMLAEGIEFTAFQARDIGDTEDLHALRHKRYNCPIALMPTQPYDFARAFKDHKVTSTMVDWLKDQVAKSGGEMIASDDLLVMMFESVLESLNSDQPVLFHAPLPSEAIK
jgi:hypothetical protein